MDKEQRVLSTELTLIYLPYSLFWKWRQSAHYATR